MTLVPVLVRETLQRHRVTLVLYHDPDPVTVALHLDALQRRYTIIDLRSFVDALRSGTTERLPRKALVVTFDDGHRRNRTLVPIFERFQVPVTIFVCASIVGTRRRYWWKHVENFEALKLLSDRDRLERLGRSGFVECGPEPEALSDREIQEMAGRQVDFQSHGLSHAILPRCEEAKARAEILDSRSALSSRYGLDIYAFSYPNGDFSEREVQLVREAGYRCGVTIEAGFNGANTDPYRIKRLRLDDTDSVNEVIVKASGVWGLISRLFERGPADRAERSRRRPAA